MDKRIVCTILAVVFFCASAFSTYYFYRKYKEAADQYIKVPAKWESSGAYDTYFNTVKKNEDEKKISLIMMFLVSGSCLLLSIVFIVLAAISESEYNVQYRTSAGGDDLDYQIEKYIDLHVNVSIDEISRALKIPRKEVKRRLKDLMDQGRIEKL